MVTIEIPAWIPPSENRARNKRWQVRHKIGKATELMIGAYAVIAGLKLVDDKYRPKRRLTFILTVRNLTHAPDPTNVLKITLDAMKRARVIVDDSADWLVVNPVVVQKGSEDHTAINVEDM